MEALHRSEHLSSRSPESAPPQDPVRCRMEQVHHKLGQLMNLGGLGALTAGESEALGVDGKRALPSLDAFETVWTALPRRRQGTVEKHLNDGLRQIQGR